MTKENLIQEIRNLSNILSQVSNDLFEDKKEEILVTKEIIEVENCIDIWSEVGTIKISKVGNQIYYLVPLGVSGYDLDVIKQKYWAEIMEAINTLNNGK